MKAKRAILAAAIAVALILTGCAAPPPAPKATPTVSLSNFADFMGRFKDAAPAVAFCLWARDAGREEENACAGPFTRAIADRARAGQELWGMQIRVEGEQLAAATTFLRSFFTGEIASAAQLHGDSNGLQLLCGRKGPERITIGLDDTPADWASRLAELKIAAAGVDSVLADPAFSRTTGISEIADLVASEALVRAKLPPIAEADPSEHAAAEKVLYGQYVSETPPSASDPGALFYRNSSGMINYLTCEDVSQ